MEDLRNVVVLSCVGLYLLVCVGVGLWALRRTKNTHDFFMAGRDLGILVTGLAVFSSTLSGFGFVGGPGLVYRMGFSSIWMVVCSSIGFVLSFYLLGKRIRLMAELRDSVSLPDAVAARYRSEASRFLTGLAILLGVMGYLATQILAMATVLQDILRASFGPISIEVCVAASCAVLVFYCVTGGIIASVYTDVVQGLVMMVAAVLVLVAAMMAVDGGFAGMSRTIMADDPEAMSPWGTIGIFGALSWYFVFALGGAGQPHVITKMMMNRRVGDARHILPVSVGAYAVSAMLWISIGLAMRALVLQGTHPSLPNADAAAPQFLQSYAHPILAGIVFAGLFAAIMSTADGFLNIGAAAVVHDIPRAFKGRPLANELRWARIATVVIAVVAALFALYSGEELVALLGAFGWGTFAAALVPTVAIGFNWKRATATAANVAIVASLLINFGTKVLGVTMPYGIDVGAVSLLVSLTLFFGISLASKPPVIDEDVAAVMDL
ncbi:MAG TPA: sodium/proline symporter [Thermoanaerobaculia bacterium]|nr:sodium/proline symporter [Thermoanaerobaculia bacterium]